MTAFTCQGSAEASQLVSAQVELGGHTESLSPAATSQKGIKRFLVGTTAGKHKPPWLIELLLHQAFPISRADVL